MELDVLFGEYEMGTSPQKLYEVVIWGLLLEMLLLVLMWGSIVRFSVSNFQGVEGIVGDFNKLGV